MSIAEWIGIDAGLLLLLWASFGFSFRKTGRALWFIGRFISRMPLLFFGRNGQ